MCCRVLVVNVTATTGIYTYRHPLSLLDALPIKPPIESPGASEKGPSGGTGAAHSGVRRLNGPGSMDRRGDADLAVADELPGQVGEDRGQHDGAADDGPRRRRPVEEQPHPEPPAEGLRGAATREERGGRKGGDGAG